MFGCVQFIAGFYRDWRRPDRVDWSWAPISSGANAAIAASAWTPGRQRCRN